MVPRLGAYRVRDTACFHCCCCSCESHYLPVAGECVDEDLIIGLSAGIGGAIVIVLLIVIIVMVLRRTSYDVTKR